MFYGYYDNFDKLPDMPTKTKRSRAYDGKHIKKMAAKRKAANKVARQSRKKNRKK